MAKVRTRKPNMQDATLRNIRALKKKTELLRGQLKTLQGLHRRLARKVDQWDLRWAKRTR